MNRYRRMGERVSYRLRRLQSPERPDSPRRFATTMRLLWALVYDLFLFLFALLLLPLRALRRRTGWLVVEVSGDPGWRAPVRSLWRLGRRRRRRPLGIASVKELVDALQKAERDRSCGASSSRSRASRARAPVWTR